MNKPVASKPPRHSWFQRTLTPIRDEASGCEKHERVCEHCKVTRTTVIPPRGKVWIEWETDAGVKTIDGYVACNRVPVEVSAL